MVQLLQFDIFRDSLDGWVAEVSEENPLSTPKATMWGWFIPSIYGDFWDRPSSSSRMPSSDMPPRRQRPPREGQAGAEPHGPHQVAVRSPWSHVQRVVIPGTTWVTCCHYDRYSKLVAWNLSQNYPSWLRFFNVFQRAEA